MEGAIISMIRGARFRLMAVIAAAVLLCACGGSTSRTASGTPAAPVPSSSRASAPTTEPGGSAQWVTLPGTMVSHTDNALLLSDGASTTQYTLIGATGQWLRTLKPSPALAPATIDNNEGYDEGAVLTQAVPQYPDGTTLVSAAATTPANGLTAETDRYYLLQFNNATGNLITKANLGAANLDQEPVPVVTSDNSASVVGTTSSSVVMERVSLASGKVEARVTIPNADYNDSYGKYVLLTIEKPVCDLLDVFDATTLSRISTNRICIPGGVPADQVFGGVAKGFFLSATQYSGQADQNANSYPFSVTTGARLGHALPKAFGGLQETVGPRSTIAVAWDSGSDQGMPMADAGFYQETTWSLVYRVHNSQGLSFSCSGIADNDIWVTTTSGNIVVNGLTGAQIESGWKLYPVAGGTGWTVFDGPQSNGSPQQYLLRSTQPAVNALASAPAPPAS